MFKPRKCYPILYFLIGFFVYLLINSYIIVRGNIYYTISYDINIPGEQEIINRVETFNLSANLNYDEYECRDKDFYFSQEYLNLYKQEIKSDIGLHFNPFYYHTFDYHFNAQSFTALSITYNNCSILDSNYSEGHFLNPWSFGFYLNHSIVPTVHNASNKITLADVIIVKVAIYYKHSGEFFGWGYGKEFIQYVVLNQDYQIILVNVPYILTYP